MQTSGATIEIKEWQAIMNYLKGLPTNNEKGVTVLVMAERTKGNRSINVRAILATNLGIGA